MSDVAYLECIAAQEAVYWEAFRQRMGLTDKNVGDLLRIAAPHLLKQKDVEMEGIRQSDITHCRLLAEANQNIVLLQHVHLMELHKMFDDVADICGYEGKDWDACVARVRDLAEGQAGG